MTSDILCPDATRLAELIRTRQVSPLEIVQTHLDRIKAVNPKVNAIVTLAPGAITEAKAAEAAVLVGNELGPLHGVPFTAKDSIDTAGVLTQLGSPIFKGHLPEVDAVSVARLRGAGAILLAKTNIPEFSYSTVTDNLLTGRSNNPWNLDRTPGVRAAGSPQLPRPVCRRSASASTWPSRYVVQPRTPESSASKQLTGAFR